MAKGILITAALPYSNGDLHVGHIGGAYLPADTYARFKRLRGETVRTVCGSDDHGVAIMLTAEKEGKSPQEIAKHYNERQKRALEALNIDFDIYSSTSRNPYHYAVSQEFFKRIYDRGFFEKKTSRQFFDSSRSMFLPDRFVKGTCAFCKAEGQYGDQCENCGAMLDTETLLSPTSVFSGQPASVRESAHWYLDLSRFRNEVSAWLDKAEIRDHTRAYVKGLLSQGLVSRAMTRDLTWGIPVPLDDPDAKGKVLYVWFDAPIGYISNTKELCERAEHDPGKVADWWQSEDTDIFHFIGEDNSIFHCVIWIAMLTATEKYRLPRGVIVNHFMNLKFPGKEAEKISKSRGNALYINDFIEQGGDPEALRYYLTAIASENARTAYQPDDLRARYNGELADILGNYISRIVQFCHKYFDGKIPARSAAKLTDADRNFLASREAALKDVTHNLDNFCFKAGLEGVMAFARSCNRYLDEKAPWTSRKTDMEATGHTLNIALNAARFLGVTISPFMPATSVRILKMLGLDAAKSWQEALEPLVEGSPLGPAEVLFPKAQA